jgi:WD40 repeat protein
MKIWNNKNPYAIMNCKSMNLNHQVNDVEWSPYTSTIFGCVADDGRVEIWDMSRLTIDPTIYHKPEGYIPSKKSIKFSNSSHVVATGNSDFDIEIFRIYNLDHVVVSDDDQKERLHNILNQNSEHSSGKF